MLLLVPPIVDAGHIGDNSCKPNNFSNSFGSRAPGRSCLFANINTGTPWKKNYIIYN